MSKRLFPLLSFVLLASASVLPVSAQSSSGNDAAHLNVELVGGEKTLQFQQATRLADVLKQAQQQSLSLQYPLGTTLFDRSEQALRASSELKNSVLSQMSQRNLAEHPFYNYLKKHQFAPRVFSALDVDNVRLNKFNNPLLRGDFTLVSPIREEKVVYLGNVDNVYSVKAQAGIPLQQQMTNLEQNFGELANSPVIIYPDGNVVQPHHGAWLTTQYYLPPLSMVYIPFEEFENSKMDQDIVQLLSQLMPTEMKKPL